MEFNATFNNISVISWQSVLLVEESGVPEKPTDLSQITDKLLSVLTPTGAWLAKWLWSLTSNRVDQEAYLCSCFL
jgi:hypothetical protein